MPLDAPVTGAGSDDAIDDVAGAAVVIGATTPLALTAELGNTVFTSMNAAGFFAEYNVRI
jgi:hypothetical protein